MYLQSCIAFIVGYLDIVHHQKLYLYTQHIISAWKIMYAACTEITSC